MTFALTNKTNPPPLMNLLVQSVQVVGPRLCQTSDSLGTLPELQASKLWVRSVFVWVTVECFSLH